MSKKMDRINEIEEMIEENGVFINDGTEMNMGILEDVYTSVDKEVNWLIACAKENIAEVERLKGKLKLKNSNQ